MPFGEPPRSRVILLAEDNDADVCLAREALADLGEDVDLQRVHNGAECLSYLRGQPPYDESPVPDLILLDLNLPVVDGLGVLAQVTRDPTLATSPIVILTTSRHERDVSEAYRLHCNAYVVKPIDYSRFGEVIAGIWRHWFELATLPPKTRTNAQVRRV